MNGLGDFQPAHCPWLHECWVKAFKNEAEEADWHASPAGRRHASRQFQEAMRKGVIETESREIAEVTRLARQSGGRAVLVKNGLSLKPTDPAVLQKLLDDARASMTKAVSLRIPQGDLDAAKRIAKRQGIGYQTVLKNIISRGLRRAS
jgi:hypothetical protein